MSAVEPLEVMGRYIAAVRGGDWEAALRFVSDDVILHVPGRSSPAGEHRGREAVRGYITAALERSHGAEVEVELVDVLASEERVALVVRERFTRDAGVVEIRRSNLYRVVGGEIVEVTIFEGDQYAVDEIFADG